MDKGAIMLNLHFFYWEKYYRLFQNDDRNSFVIAEFSYEQISSSTFLDIFNLICIWLVLNGVTE